MERQIEISAESKIVYWSSVTDIACYYDNYILDFTAILIL